MIVRISPVELVDFSASLRTSSATTANPRPCSPARAASMAAFNANRFVWDAISSMVWMIVPISAVRLPSSITPFRKGLGRQPDLLHPVIGFSDDFLTLLGEAGNV